MNKNCSCGGSFLAIIILVFSFWQLSFSKWVIIGAAILLLIVPHMKCKCCKDDCCLGECEIETVKKKPVKKKVAKKKK